MKKIFLLSIVLLFITLKPSNSLEIDCNFKLFYFGEIGALYLCSVTNLSNLSEQKVTKISGIHQSGKTNKDVEAIWIEDNKSLSNFPKGVSKFFPNLKAFLIFDANIKELFGDELNEFPLLQFISLQYCGLKKISSNLFVNTPNLVLINFNNNLLEKVGHDLFKPLDVMKIHRLGFLNNRCISKEEINGNLAIFVEIIKEVQENCKFDDEVFIK